MNQDNIFTTIYEFGNEVNYKILYIKNVDNIPIVWYTDGTFDKSGRQKIFISSYQKQDKIFLLSNIESEIELQKYINIFINDIK